MLGTDTAAMHLGLLADAVDVESPAAAQEDIDVVRLDLHAQAW